jgi:hypothetical protein
MAQAADTTLQRFLRNKVRALAARSRRLARLTPQEVGIRPQDIRYLPPLTHFVAANRRLAEIDRSVRRHLAELHKQLGTSSPRNVLVYAAMVEREIDRARRAFGMFFEIFAQRGTTFAGVLAAYDAIAADCYAAIRASSPTILLPGLLKPITYMEHGYSPATMRRGVTLARLLGESNPFPLIRVPWDRDNPWQSVFAHEVGHNIQADLRLWDENREALVRRMQTTVPDPFVAATFGLWQKEIFADLVAILLGGPASVWGMMDFLAHPFPQVMTFRPGGAHPSGYFRVPLQAEMLRRMGFTAEASKVTSVWRKLYDPRLGHRLPSGLLKTAGQILPQVVDEIAFQPKRGLAQRALADVVRFTRDDEKEIRRGSRQLARGVVPKDLPPRFMLSASRHAIGLGADLPRMSQLVIEHLAAAARREDPGIPVKMAA